MALGLVSNNATAEEEEEEDEEQEHVFSTKDIFNSKHFAAAGIFSQIVSVTHCLR